MHGHSMKEIRDMEAFHNLVRNIDVVELWSGCQSICNAARLGGYVAKPFDKHRSPGVTDVPGEHNEDITTKPGFNKALGLVLGLRENGLLWMAPVCSSFCWLNLSNTKRSKENKYRGATHSAVAKEANKMALSAMLLAEVAIERGVQVVIENPPASYLWKFLGTSIQKHLRFSSTCARCGFTGPVEKGSNLKLYKFHGSSRWVESLACTCKCPPGTHEKLTKTENVNGKIMVTGIPSRLKESQAYTKKMGEAVINAWLDGGDDDPDVSGPDIHKPLPKKQKQTSSSVGMSPMRRPAAAGGGGNRDWQSLYSASVQSASTMKAEGKSRCKKLPKKAAPPCRSWCKLPL